MKFKLVLSVLLHIAICPLQSQVNYSTSTTPNDSLRIMGLLDQTREVYVRNQYDSVITQSENILEECQKIGFIRGAGESYFLKARALNRLGRKEKAMEIYQLAVNQFLAIEDHARTASVYNNWGLILKAMGRFREAIETGELALDYIRLKPTGKLQFHILNNLGNSYQNIALTKKASSAYFEALQVLKQESDSLYKQQMQAEVYINLGLIYYEQKLYDKSQEIFRQALKTFESQEIKPQLASVYNNLGILYAETQELQKATDYLNMAYNLCLELNNMVEATVCKANSGKVFLAQKNYAKAISTYQKVISDFEQLNAPAFLPSSYLGLGETFTKAGIYDKAELALLKGLQMALKSGQKNKELELYEGLISFHKSVGELDIAIMYYDLYSALSQELNDQQIGRFIGQLELKNLIEKRDLALESLETEAASLQFQLNQRNVLLALSVLLIILVSAFFALAFRQYRLKTIHQNLALEQKILRTQLNPHFIFNALGAIQHYMIDHAPESAAGYLSKFSKLMRAILECSRTSHTSLSVEIDNIKHYLELQSLRFPKLFKYSIDVDPGIQPDLIRIPSLLIQPLLENAVEHGLIPNHGGRIRVVIQQEEDHIIINVEDDGVGIDRYKLIGTHHKGRQSLGNTIIQERLSLINQRNKGKILFDIKNRSEFDKSLSGTHASLKIPLTP